MTLNQLECFMVLAQRLNFTQAADDLVMAQPALSRLISALERELVLQLFYRNSRSVALTPAGTVFFKKCPKILDEYRGSVVAARLAQEGSREPARVSPEPTLAEGIAIGVPMRGEEILEYAYKYHVQFIHAPEEKILEGFLR